MSQAETGHAGLFERASARFSSRRSAVLLSLLSLLLYMASDFFSKSCLSHIPVPYISLFRFACGLPLLAFTRREEFVNRKVILFAGANVLNSVCGVFAIISGSLSGFALAGQLRPVFIILFCAIVYRYRYALSSWLCFTGIMVCSIFLFTINDAFSQTANLIYIFSVAMQAFVFAGIGRNPGESLISFLAVYNLSGFVLMLAYIIVCSLPVPDLSSVLILAGNGALAMSGSILTLLSLATDYKLEASSVNYARLPLTLLFSWLLLDERLPVLVWISIIGVLILVCLLSRDKGKP
ncbi:UNVERIFIED_ORG: drug/metabolite transporter (DMT)-like permease [Kosakonia oryzae]|uniref:EamA-like transporter family protein n=1 Tax=Kosakonia radicincitans TaxID=283686 RepID=A0AAX2EVW8_9ENTR|nr:hypothetical protein [Kosakonia radicincitans]MDP9568875.1 drug/metabolite transporter (DMT)-like permease [Kosakonia oryzae]SFF14147.1 hypothetical protein SAMN03159468_03898 [Kosakonia radicincitans]SFR21873.1 hypothetical protein SAMN03159514_03692 [Kosakonia radicincitans]SFT98188.1 hypothetical protein SAMN03159428_03153 [Kosakonia radicincitans]SFY13027.1 hypothetical protein SAMN03159436_03883 [Kosakonia radicincitans]